MALECLDQSLDLLAEPGEGIDTAVHSARKNLKRIRAVLRFLRDVLGEETFRIENAVYRDAGRRLAPLRDSVVLIETLDAVCDHFSHLLPPGAFSRIRQKLVAHNAAVRRQFLGEANTLVDVVDHLQAARGRLEQMPIEAYDFTDYAAGIHRVYRRGRQRMERAYADPFARPALFHDWRKRVKYLWHQLEMLEPIWPVVLQEMARELHHLSDLLGDAHDLVLLKEFLLAKSNYFDDDPEMPPLIPLLTEQRRTLELAARPYGRRLYTELPAGFVNRLGRYWQIWQEDGINGAPQPDLPPSDWIGTQAAAGALNLSPAQVRAQLAQGRLPGIKVSGVWLIPRTAVTPVAGGKVG